MMFETALQEFVFYDKYSRYNWELGRRETWDETVDRVMAYLVELSEYKLDEIQYQEIDKAIRSGKVSPSMRLMATAGDAARKNPLLLYNCSYLPVTSLDAFSEILWLSMSGVGVGYSVERQYINMLPEIDVQRGGDPLPTHIIEDSAEGWVVAYYLGLRSWWRGMDIEFDYSQIRPHGTPLKTKGGTASGPDVLIDLMERTRDMLLLNQGRKLRPIQVFDIITTIGNCAVSGGTRRSAQICMFDREDDEMLNAKQGEFWKDHPYRVNANISAVWDRQLSDNEIRAQMDAMFNGMAGEPGIVSRLAMNNTRPYRRRKLEHGGLNPCAEINLHGATVDGRFGGQLCNLSSVNLRAGMTVREIMHNARIAARIGTIQAIATNFKMLRPTWKEICEEERLIGVSVIGFSDNKKFHSEQVMKLAQDVVVSENIITAMRLGINPSPATTCVKPSGNSSVLYGTGRGINPRYSSHYVRRVRVGAATPVYDVLVNAGMELTPENGQINWENPTTYVAEFFEKSPSGATTIDMVSALDQLELWLKVKKHFTEHNPSITVEYGEDEKEQIVKWLIDNQFDVNGIAFLPRVDSVYHQAPYEKITEQQYKDGFKPVLDWSLLNAEETDGTRRELECAGGVCDLF
jgi:ribonucleoside-triphosphate reductase